MHVLVIGQQSMVLSVEEVDVPDAQQSQQDGSVLVQRSGAKVVVLQQTVRHGFTIMYSASCLQESSYEFSALWRWSLPSNELLTEAFQSC